MRLGSPVDNSIDIVLADRGTHGLGVTDIALDEMVARVILDRLEVIGVAGIGQLVEDDGMIVGLGRQKMMNKVGADKARAAGD